MNQNLHRIVFNRRRGLWMAVSESAPAQGKDSRGKLPSRRLRASALAALAVAASIGAEDSFAQIAADRTAPKRQQPTVLETNNGVPLVNVRTPSAGGVSRNTYSQFDVGSQGAILNNGRTASSTQLAGPVAGNPWLARGSARVLLNEVRSNDPSRLQGLLEVAGERAEVVIANPSGIQVDGAGFLNTSRLTLTTGTPVIDAGAVSGWQVRRGAVTIAGGGLDARATDYTAILAQAIQVNAGLWAQDLRVVGGAADVDARHVPTATATAGGNALAQGLAVDVSQLGGMYAGRIHLIGTQAGLGVRLAGEAIARGDLVLHADGSLAHSGALQAGSAITVSAGEHVAMDGTAHAGTALQVTSGGTLALGAEARVSASGNVALHAGSTAAAGTLTAARGALVAAGLQADGQMGHAGTLSISAGGAVDFQGRGVAGNEVLAEAPRLSFRGATLDAQRLVLHANGGSVDAREATLRADDRLDVQATGALHSDGGTLTASQLALSAASVSNAGGYLGQSGHGPLVLATPGTLDNRGGTIASASADASVAVGTLLNQGGRIEHVGTGTLSLAASAIDNAGGRIVGNGDVVVDADVVRNDGALSARHDLRITARASLDNGAGLVVGGRDLTVAAARLDVGQGALNADEGRLRIDAGSVVNPGGVLRAGARLDIDAGSFRQAASGVLSAGWRGSVASTDPASLTIHARDAVVSAGSHRATGRLELTGASLDLTGSRSEAAEVVLRAEDGKVSTSNANVSTPGALLIDTAGATAGLLNIGGHLQAGSVTVMGGDVDNAAGRMTARGTLTLSAKDFNNREGTLEGGSIAVDASRLDNTTGRIVQSGNGAATVVVRGALEGTQGVIRTDGPAALQVGQLELGSGSQIVSAERLTVSAGEARIAGRVQARGRLEAEIAGRLALSGGMGAGASLTLRADTVQMAADAVMAAGIERDGMPAGQGGLSVHAQVLDLHGGLMAREAVELTADRLDLRAGRIEGADVRLQAQAGPIQTAGARIVTPGALRVQAQGGLDNAAGLLSGGTVEVRAASIDNRLGEILQTGNTERSTLQAAALLDNRGGRIAMAANRVALLAGSLANAAGTIEHAGADQLALQAREFDGSKGLIASNGQVHIESGRLSLEGAWTLAQSLRLRADDVNHQHGRMMLWGTDANTLQVGGTLDNRGAETAATGALVLRAASLDNRGGAITSADTLAVETTQRLDNDSGILAARSMSLRADTLLARSGRVEAMDGTLTVQATTVDQRGGRIVTGQDLRGEAAHWDNRNGILEAQGGEARLIVGSFDNEDGRVRSAGSLTLHAHRVDGRGAMYAGSDLVASTGERLVLNGTWAAGRDLRIDTPGLAATAGSVLAAGLDDGGRASGTGDVRLDTGTQGLRLGGQLVAAGSAALAGGSLDLQGGRITADKLLLTARTGHVELDAATIDLQGNLDVTTTGGTVRTANARVAAQRMQIDAQDLDNRNGQLVLRGDGTSVLKLHGALDNRGGSIATRGGMVIHAATLANAGGQLAADGAGPLSVTVAGVADNQGGLMAARQALALHAGALDNTQGMIAAIDGPLQVATTGAIDNRGGRLQSLGDLSLAAAGLRNGSAEGLGGQIVGRHVRIDTTGQAFDNREGTVVATGVLDVSTGRMDNEHGNVAAFGDARLQATTLANSAGRWSAGGRLNLQANRIDNAAGTLEGVKALSADVGSGAIDNRSGSMRSAGKVDVTAGTLDNRDTLAPQAGVAGAAVLVSAAQVDNSRGRIAADGNLQLGEADRAITLVNAGGELLAGEQLSLRVRSLDDPGKLVAGRAISLAIGSDWHNASSLASGGALDITVAGALTNDGRIQSAGRLSVDARDLDNRAGGELSGGQAQIRVDGLVNRGLIDGQDVSITASRLDNLGTGRIYGDRLALRATQLVNDTELVAEQRTDAVIAARERLDIGAGTVFNREHAMLFSAGAMAIGGALDEARRAFGQATLVHNASATIEALGDLSISAAEIRNTNEHLRVGEQAGAATERVVHLVGGTAYDQAEVAFIRNRGYRESETFYDYTLQKFLTDDTPLGGVADKFLLLPSTAYPLDRFGPAGGLSAIPAAAYRPPESNGLEGHGVTTPAFYAPPESVPWALFGVRQPEPMPDPASPAFDDWKSRNHALYIEFDARVDAFAADVAQRRVGDWTILRFVEQRTEPVLLSSDPGRIRAGGHARLDGHLVNQASQVTAGGTLLATGQIDNLAIEGTARVERDGTAIYAYRSGGDRKYRRTPYATDVEQTVTVAAADVQGGVTTNLDVAVAPAAAAPLIGLAVPAAGTSVSSPAPAVFTEVVSAPASNHRERTGAVPVADSVGSIRSREAALAWPVDPNEVSAPEPRARTGAGQLVSDARVDSNRGQAATPLPASGEFTATTARAAGPLQAQQVVRTVRLPLALPAGALFRLNAGGDHLVETDPRFAGRNTWLSSDAWLSRLPGDPASAMQRLGDGFYEQQLVREQIGQLTGYRFLQGFAADETQYRALLDAGSTFAKTHALRPGVALSAEQMAQLTSDIVWLVARDVTLPDGSSRPVLVPQVYVRVREGDLRGDGTLISADALSLALDGDLVNSGTLAGRQVLALTAENVRNLGGRLSGDTVAAAARVDLENIGGRIDAATSMMLGAGRDLTLETTLRSASSTAGTDNRFERTVVDRVAALHVSGAAGQLIVEAGRDLLLRGARVDNDGSGGTLLSAAQDIAFGSVSTHEADRLVWNRKNWRDSTTDSIVGTTVDSKGALAVSANRDVAAEAATLRSDDAAVTVTAGRDLTLSAGRAAATLQEAHFQRSSGLLRSSSKQTWDDSAHEDSVATTVSGHTLDLSAGRDLKVIGSQVVSDAGTVLGAARDLTLQAGEDASREEHLVKTRRSGLFSNGLGFTIGSQRMMLDGAETSTHAAVSTVGATDGDVVLRAGADYRQTGSALTALEGDITVAAQRIVIDEARERSTGSLIQKFDQHGLSVSFSSAATDTLQTIAKQARAAARSGDARYQALAAGVILLNASNLLDGQSPTNGQQRKGTESPESKQGNETSKGAGALQVSVSIGSSSSRSASHSLRDSAIGSTLTAGGGVTLQALGSADRSDIVVQGSTLSAAREIGLIADGDVILRDARSHVEQRSKNSSRSASLSASVGLGSQQSGLAVGISTTSGEGRGNGRSDTGTPTEIHGSEIVIASGRDTVLEGAIASGDRIRADVNGNLRIESTQDSSTEHVAQESTGINVSLTAAGAPAFDIQQNRLKGESNYRSVIERSGMLAGDGGFQVRVDGDVTLIGGAIASSPVAATEARNTLDARSLTSRNIENSSSASVHSAHVGFSSNVLSQGKYGIAKTIGLAALDQVSGSTSQQSTTTSTISAATTHFSGEASSMSDRNAEASVTSPNLSANEQPTGRLEHTALDKLRDTVEAKQDIKSEALHELASYADAAHHKMFLSEPQFQKVECPPEEDCVRKPELAVTKKVGGSVSDAVEEIRNIQGRVIISVNGINNNLERAAQLALQNSEPDSPAGIAVKNTPIYLLHYENTNWVSELMIAGYELFGAPLFGDSKQTVAYRFAVGARDSGETIALGHSRGTLVQLNAARILGEQGFSNPDLQIRALGSPVNADKFIKGVSAILKQGGSVSFRYFENDPVSVLLGGNPGNVSLGDITSLIRSPNSAHSCYGTGAAGCRQVEILTNNAPENAVQRNEGLVRKDYSQPKVEKSGP